MRILQLAPLWFPVSPDSIGGIETFLAGLIQALQARGCRNTLLATGDSRTAAEVVPVVGENLYARMASGAASEYDYYEQEQLLQALARAGDFDLVHSHIGPRAFALAGVPGLRVLHTWHTQIYPDLEWFVRRHPELRLSAVSEFQAGKLRAHGAVHCDVIHNGLDVASFPFEPTAGDGLLFIGRLDRTKGPDLAVQVARASSRRLVLAGPITDPDLFATAVEPFLDDRIRYVGVVDHRQKRELFAGAACVLVPSRVEEACPLVALEAQACGRPVVALANGGLPELVEPGVTGYVTDDERRLPELVSRALGLDRALIRARATERFDLAAVAGRYHELYVKMMAGSA